MDSFIPAEVFNLYRALLIRNDNNPVFVPIRSMQYLTVLDQHKIYFIDSQAYAVADNTGGRMILLAWQFDKALQRDSLNKPAPCNMIFYEHKNDEVRLRLIPEFKQAMESIDQRYRDRLPKQDVINIIPWLSPE